MKRASALLPSFFRAHPADPGQGAAAVPPGYLPQGAPPTSPGSSGFTSPGPAPDNDIALDNDIVVEAVEGAEEEDSEAAKVVETVEEEVGWAVGSGVGLEEDLAVVLVEGLVEVKVGDSAVAMAVAMAEDLVEVEVEGSVVAMEEAYGAYRGSIKRRIKEHLGQFIQLRYVILL